MTPWPPARARTKPSVHLSPSTFGPVKAKSQLHTEPATIRSAR